MDSLAGRVSSSLTAYGPLAPGDQRYRRQPLLYGGRFLLVYVAGQFFWILLYGRMGYLFAVQGELVSRALSAFSGIPMVLFFLVMDFYFLMKRHKFKFDQG